MQAKYLFCYDTIQDYLKAFDDYSNSKQNQVKDVKKPKQTEAEEEADDKHLYDNVASIEAHKKDKKSIKKERKQDAKKEGATNAPAASEEKPAAENAAKTVPETKSDQPPEIKTKSPGTKGLGKAAAEGGGTPKGSVKGSKKFARKSTKKQDQLYENIMQDTKL